MDWWHQDVRLNRRSRYRDLEYEKLVETLLSSYLILISLPTMLTQITDSPKPREGKAESIWSRKPTCYGQGYHSKTGGK